MSEPIRGTRTRLWLRHCLTRDRCPTTTVTDEPPIGAPIAAPSPASYLPTSIEFLRFERSAVRRLLDRDPGEEG
jgi:hypothetical protein